MNIVVRKKGIDPIIRKWYILVVDGLGTCGKDL